MTTWRDHKGDRMGFRIAFTPPTAEIVPMHCSVTVPVADQIEASHPGTILSGRLPLFYWRSNGGPMNPLQRGDNTFDLPQYTEKLELGCFMDIRRQVDDNEYMIEETTGLQVLREVIFKIGAPPGNINLPRFGERQYTMDATRLNLNRPTVISDILCSQTVYSTKVSFMNVYVTFNRPINFPVFMSMRDCLNRFIDPDSRARLETVDPPNGAMRWPVFNDNRNQPGQGNRFQPAWVGAIGFAAASLTENAWTSMSESVYSIPGPNLGKKGFQIPLGTRRVRLRYTFDRAALNAALTEAGKTQAWERVFLHFLKDSKTTELDSRLYRDIDVEPMEITYSIL